MRVAVFLADGFEDVEAIGPIDLFRRAGLIVDTISVNNTSNVLTSHKIPLKADKVLDKKHIDLSSYSAILLPGGGLGVQNLLKEEELQLAIKDYYLKGGLVCAICAAPMVLGKIGLLKDKSFTCFAGCEEGLDGLYTAKEVEVDGNIITARSMLYSVPFALTIIERLLGKEVKERIYKQIEGLNRK